MKSLRKSANLTGAMALMFVGAPTLTLPAAAHAIAPMPPACQAASSQVEAEGSRYRTPPQSESTVVQLQHVLFLTGLLLDALDASCRDWADYSSTRASFQATYDATLTTCHQIASNSADCRRQAYGG